MMENAKALQAIYGEGDSDAIEQIEAMSGKKHAVVGEFWSFGGIDIEFDEGELAGEFEHYIPLYDLDLTDGVGTISQMDEMDGIIIKDTTTVVFFGDGGVFCQLHMEMTDGRETGMVIMRFLLEPDVDLTGQTGGSSDPGGSTGSGDISVVDDPTLDDFDWYFDDVINNGILADARIMDDDEIFGDWKLMTRLYPEYEFGDDDGYFLHIVNFEEIDGEIIMKIQYISAIWDDGMEDDLSMWDDDIYTGDFRDNGSGIFAGYPDLEGEAYYGYTITDFFEIGGKQYAIGEETYPDGTAAYAALVRP